MALELVRALAQTELDDHLHMARLLLLVEAHSGRVDRPFDGITKLAKLDFLLRYPNCLERAMNAKEKPIGPANFQYYERTTIESKMIRFRYGPWDPRYRRWIALLVSKGLLHADVEGRTVKLRITDAGKKVAFALGGEPELCDLAKRAKLIASTFGSMSGNGLKAFVYATFPEITDMKWGDPITI